MNTDILKEINDIQHNTELSLEEKEASLHTLEGMYRNVFIKTDLCPHCKRLTVDVWYKEQRFAIEGETEMKNPEFEHRPPKNNFGTMEENMDEDGEFNPW